MLARLARYRGENRAENSSNSKLITKNRAENRAEKQLQEPLTKVPPIEFAAYSFALAA